MVQCAGAYCTLQIAGVPEYGLISAFETRGISRRYNPENFLLGI
jgi:hypothetical protein